MKIIERNILSFQEKDIFPPIRSKVDYAKLLVLSVRILLLDNCPSKGDMSCLKLIINKMNRLFFYSQNKYFSISFPFTVLLDEQNQITSISTYSGAEIDSKIISEILTILTNKQCNNYFSLFDFYIESEGRDANGVDILEEIFQFEPSYVRYDHDPEHENEKLHPLHHLDINYSTYGTFKLGLKGAINNTSFEDIHDINTDCSYLAD